VPRKGESPPPMCCCRLVGTFRSVPWSGLCCRSTVVAVEAVLACPSEENTASTGAIVKDERDRAAACRRLMGVAVVVAEWHLRKCAMVGAAADGAAACCWCCWQHVLRWQCQVSRLLGRLSAVRSAAVWLLVSRIEKTSCWSDSV
jgi:hypothetical protein